MNYILYYYDLKFKKVRQVFDIVDTLDDAKLSSFEMQNEGKILHYLPEDQFVKLKEGKDALRIYKEIKKEGLRANTSR